MQSTGYLFDGKEISYEILADGYNIYLGGNLWITQRVDEYIPFRDEDPTLDLESCCIKQIEDIVNSAAMAEQNN